LPRKSSLAAVVDTHVKSGGTVLLGLSDVPPVASDGEGVVSIIIPDDMIMPHNPPLRRSSLDFGPDVIIELKQHEFDQSLIQHTDRNSVMSALTPTETTSSAEALSPSSSAPHPLSSATTSLSRSAKGDKEPNSEKDAADSALSALQLQRSLDWEATQLRRRRKTEKRKMILLELVETEVAYAEDTKTLVQVYLPQLYALPSISERTADRIARNAKDLCALHNDLAVKMVEVLRDEGLNYELQAEPLLEGNVERASRRLAALLVDNVSRLADAQCLSDLSGSGDGLLGVQ
jgi:hypothetical protein